MAGDHLSHSFVEKVSLVPGLEGSKNEDKYGPDMDDGCCIMQVVLS